MPAAKAKPAVRKVARKAAVGRAVARPALPAVRDAPAALSAPLPPAPAPSPPVRRIEEPVWLVRAVLLLFLVGFAAFLAREAYLLVRALS